MVRPDDFTRMVDATLPAVSRYALRRAPSADAEEVVAETYAVAWRRRHDIPDIDAALPWLYAVARRVLSNERRGRRRWERLQAKASVQRPTSVAADPAEFAEGQPVRDALGRLPDLDAELLRLLTWERLSHAEAAAVLEMSENAVALRASRARRKLAEILDDRSPNVVDMQGRANRRRSDVV